MKIRELRVCVRPWGREFMDRIWDFYDNFKIFQVFRIFCSLTAVSTLYFCWSQFYFEIISTFQPFGAPKFSHFFKFT